MKKLLLIGLVVGGLGFVAGERVDAQITAGLPGVGGLSFGFPGTVMPIRRATIIIHTGTTSDRTTLMPSRIRTITRARDTPGITGIGLLIVTIAIIITTVSELP